MESEVHNRASYGHVHCWRDTSKTPNVSFFYLKPTTVCYIQGHCVLGRDSQKSEVVIFLGAAAGISEVLAALVLDVVVVVLLSLCFTHLVSAGCTTGRQRSTHTHTYRSLC